MPWVDDSQLAYEHLHRYAWAREHVSGLDVLDLGSGEGLGASILSGVARSVIGVDVDKEAVAHAASNYGSSTLQFIVDDARTAESVATESVDVVVAFEVIEHVTDQDAVLATIARVLRPGGMVFLSTPNRLLYRTEAEGPNPFHERELDPDEFRELIQRQFAHVALHVQRAQAGSRIDASEPNVGDREEVARFERVGETWAEVGPPAPYYLLAVASASPLPVLARGSTLIDASLDIVRTTREALARQLAESYENAHRERIEAVLAEHDRELGAAREREAALSGQIESLVAERLHEIARLEASHREAVARLQKTVDEADAVADAARAEAVRLADHAHEAHRLALRVSGSITWRALERARRHLYRPDGRPTLPGRAVSGSLKLAQRLFGNRSDTKVAIAAQPDAFSASDLRPVVVPSSTEPLVSIVIPVYRGASLLHQCLQTIASNAGDVSFEVIVVNDDPGDADVGALLAVTSGVRVIVNEQNLGFLESSNVGVAASLGQYVVLLNSDTEPQAGWLDALLDRFARVPALALAGSRLIYPDGRLQEAGGVIFRDGSAMNYGNGADPEDPRYTFARPVDYCSAAAVMVRRDVWNELGGFDPVFAPAYYEDVDFCFRARRSGYEVWFEPRARVIHHEGGSHGTDLRKGVKRHQRLNQERFLERWKEEISGAPAVHHALRLEGATADRRTGPRIVVYDHQIPAADQDAGSLRMESILELLAQEGARPLFVPANSVDLPEYRSRLEVAGVEVAVPPWSPDLSSVMERVGADADIALLSRVLVAAPVLPMVREHLPRAQVVFDTVDLHHRREAGRLADSHDLGSTVPAAYRELEYAVMRASDLTVVVSQEEKDYLLAEVPNLPVAVIPVANKVRSDVPPRADRRGFIFVGGYRHPPNVDAARWLGESIWPAARGAGVAGPLEIIGPDAPSEVVELDGGDLAVRGWVPDLEPVLDGALALVAPLRYGAGTKGKVTQALANGLPVITTPIGAEGLDLVDGESAIIAESNSDFVNAMRRLERDPELWQRLSENGQRCMKNSNSIDALRSSLDAILSLVNRR